MKNTIKAFIGIAALMMIISACKKQDYSLGDLTPPTNLAILTEVVGQDDLHPNGDGSGEVKITVTADNALSYTVDYDANTDVKMEYLPNGSVTTKYTKNGTFTYTITAVVYGKGGTSSTITKDVTVRSDFSPAAQIVTDLTGDASKTWVVDKDIPAHFGVGPWNAASVRPEWWAGAINEKLSCCPCFYSAKFTFTKVTASNTFTLTVVTDAAFTKTGVLAGGLPGIPETGDEGCYSYGGGTSDFSFIFATTKVPAQPSVPANSPSTQTSILLAGVNTYIGYGAVLKEYEILEVTPTYLYLRVQGTETGNAWYLKLKAL